MPTQSFTLSRPNTYRVMTYQRQAGNKLAIVSDSIGSYHGMVTTLNKVWSRTPNYQSFRKTRKRLPALPFTYSREILRNTYGSAAYYPRVVGDLGQYWTGNLQTSPFAITQASYLTVPPSDQTTLYGVASNAVLLELKDQKVNIAQAFAERHQTVNLIATTAVRLADTMMLLRQGKFGAAAKALGVRSSRSRRARYGKAWGRSPENASASAWLELQYGWKPLLADIYGSAEAVAQAQASWISNNVSVKKKRVYDSSVSSFGANGSIPGATQTDETIKHSEYSVKFDLRYIISNEGLHTLSQVGLSNPALLAWELLPFSFVVDWFLPVGNFISSWDATLGLKFGSGSVVTCLKQYVQQRRYINFSNSTFYGSGFCSRNQTSVVIIRTPLFSWPTIRFPEFKNPVSFTHALNAIALLSIAFKR
jgi:hypothetical protein